MYRLLQLCLCLALTTAMSVPALSQDKPPKKAEVEKILAAIIDGTIEEPEDLALARLTNAKAADVKRYLGKVIENEPGRAASALRVAGLLKVDGLEGSCSKIIGGPQRLDVYRMMLNVQSTKYMDFLLKRWKAADARENGGDFSELSDLFLRYSFPLKHLDTFKQAVADEKAEVARRAEAANVVGRALLMDVDRDYAEFLKKVEARSKVIKEASKSFSPPKFSDDIVAQRRRNFADNQLLEGNLVVEGKSLIEYEFKDGRGKRPFTLTVDVFTLDDAAIDIFMISSGYDWKLTSTQNAWQLAKVPSDEKVAREQGKWYTVEIVVGDTVKSNDGKDGRKLSFKVNETVVKTDAVFDGEMEILQFKSFDGKLVFGRCHIK